MKLTKELYKEIQDLKQKNDVIILAHTYQIGEIQDIADYVGDSLGLALKIKDIKQKNIIFCGVRFMAETAKVLAPDKNIILPVLNALCPMAMMGKPDKIREFKQINPDYKVVSYVNSTLETKAESYACCTSSNAVNVVASVKEAPVLFVPDKNLGSYVKKQLNKDNLELWDGHCSVHNQIRKNDVLNLKRQYPKAKVLAHPECRDEVLDLADFVASTGGIIDYVKNTKDDEFIIITECGIKHQLKKYKKNAKFYFIDTMICKNMKKITLESVYDALNSLEPSIEVDLNLAKKAKEAIENMLTLSK